MGEWYDDRPDWDTAAILTLSADRSGVDAALTRGFFISGHVSDAVTGLGLTGINVIGSDTATPCCVDARRAS